MNLEKCNNQNQKEFSTFASMYTNYIEELSEYSERLKGKAVTLYETAQIWCASNIEKYFVLKENKTVGFLLLGIKDNKHEFADYFIAEFYVVHKKQGQGIGSSAMREILQKQKGRYCLFVLNKNTAASRFWDNAFSDSDYINVSEKYSCNCTPDDCEFRIYEPA